MTSETKPTKTLAETLTDLRAMIDRDQAKGAIEHPELLRAMINLVESANARAEHWESEAKRLACARPIPTPTPVAVPAMPSMMSPGINATAGGAGIGHGGFSGPPMSHPIGMQSPGSQRPAAPGL